MRGLIPPVSSRAIPHRLIGHADRYGIVAYGQDGVRVFDWENPLQSHQIGFFDTYPANDTIHASSYLDGMGCQDVYADLPSGLLLTVDRTGGLFLLQAPYGYSAVQLPEPPHVAPTPGLFPNPARGSVTVRLPYEPTELTVEVLDALGRRVRPAMTWRHDAQQVAVPLAGVAPGVYWLRLLRPDEPPRTERLVVD